MGDTPSPSDQEFPIVFWNGRLAQARPDSSSQYAHALGGPLELRVEGHPKGQRPLHRILTLDLTDPAIGVDRPAVPVLPLLYGLVYDGSVLRYEVLSGSRVRIVELDPNVSSEDWPYEGCPAEFPRVPLRFEPATACSGEGLDALVWQGFERGAKDRLLAVVPDRPIGSCSIWGPDAAGMDIQIIFDFDPATGIVFASNQCD